MEENLSAGSNDDKCRHSIEACLKEIKIISENYPNHPITRDFFRQASRIPEKDISFYFGSFLAYKQAAGYSPSNCEKQISKEISKNVSVEKLRDFNKEKWSWKELYTKDNNKRFQTFVVVCDVHDIMCDPFYRAMSLVAAREMKADHIIFNGDIFDSPEISTYSQRPSEYKPRERYKWVHDYFRDFREVVPDASMEFVEGNHEYRLIKYLVDKSPYVMDVLDLQGYDAKKFLGLDQFEINYYSRSDFGTFTENDIQREVKRNYYKFRDIVLFHHYTSEGMKFGMPGISGHHHKFQVWPKFNTTYGSYSWYQSGGGVRNYVDYEVMMGERWNNGFFTIIVDIENKKNTIFNYIDTSGEYCYLNGLMHKRSEREMKFIR